MSEIPGNGTYSIEKRVEHLELRVYDQGAKLLADIVELKESLLETRRWFSDEWTSSLDTIKAMFEELRAEVVKPEVAKSKRKTTKGRAKR